MRIPARWLLASFTTISVFAACSSSSDDGPGAGGDGGTVSPDGGVILEDGAVAACGKNTTLCPQGAPCTSADDCVTDFCQEICTTASHTDGKQDDGETGIDCGGTAPKKCEAGQGCASNTDCDNLACDPSSMKCLPASHTDGLQNGDETGIDCGGPTAPNKCPPGQGCASDTDCNNTRCNTTTLVCDPASATDGLKNGTETDIDCGGAGAPACAVGLQCAGVDANCASSVCNYAKKCVEAPSCRNQHGGDTCGPAGSLESCCVSPPVGGVHLDKYSITAGRMRTFVEDPAINGNIQNYITTHKPAWWQDTWTAFLPTTMDNMGNTPDDNTPWSGFYQDVGPFVHNPDGGGNEGCNIRGFGARTYRLPDAVNTRIGDEQDYTQADLDERALNCTPVYIFAAFCAWDGGQIAGKNILNTAWGAAKYPWGAGGNPPSVSGSPAGYDKSHPSDPMGMSQGGVAVYETYGDFQSGVKVSSPFNPNPDELWASYNFNYWGGATQAFSANCSGGANYCDQSIFVAPPGRFPNGNSASGHSDLAGNVFNSTLDFSGSQVYWSRNGSWEGHAIPYGNDLFPPTNKYLAMGARCVRP